jgi:hypothetical protein
LDPTNFGKDDAGRNPWLPAPVKSSSGWFASRALLLLVLVAALAALYTLATLRWSYSDGERVGWVQKFSKKGWICKTWEGELAMVTMPGAIPEKFYFTVRDDLVAERLNRSLGKRVALIYSEHKGIPTTCFGETGYFVSEVRVVGDGVDSPGLR